MWNRKEQWKENEWTQEKATPEGEKEGPLNRFSPEIERTKSTGQPATLGTSIQIKGELTGNEDITIDGKVEGKIELRQHQLTIGPSGKIKADIHAKRITIKGEVQGNISAQEVVEIQAGGRLRGDIITPRIAIADGAFFKGSIEMEEGRPAAKQQPANQERVPQQPAEALLAKSSKG